LFNKSASFPNFLSFQSQSIEKAMERRIGRFKEFRRHISGRARDHFNMLLSQRGYVGKITFLHDAEQLNIEVCRKFCNTFFCLSYFRL